MGNFLKRMAVNIVGIPLILGTIYAGGVVFTGFVLIISFFALYEFYGLARKGGYTPFLLPGLVIGLLWIVSVYAFSNLGELIFAFILVFLFVFALMNEIKGSIANVSITLFGLIYIPFFISFLVKLRSGFGDFVLGRDLVLILFVAVWVCDSLAYVVGKVIGRHKLSPLISPKKTIEGSVAGFLGSVAVFLFFFYCSEWLREVLSLSEVVILGVIVGVFAQLGDLVESMFKRDVGEKDSSNFLPGHGGFLDRFDAFFVVSPVYYVFVKVLVLI